MPGRVAAVKSLSIYQCAAIWGTKEFSAINAVQNRAIRFFLGVGRYTPNVAVGGEMGWVPAVVKQWKNVLGHWFRLNAMDDNRINKKVFNWSFSLKQRNKNWCFQVENQFKVSNSLTIMPIKDTNYSIHGRKCIINELQSRMFVDFQTEWNSKLLSNRSIVNNNGGNKLRTYRMFKENYQTENYVKSTHISRRNRSALAKFRTGVAPLRVETGRYESLQLGQRVCFNCKNSVEDERHVLIDCPIYEGIRSDLYVKSRNINSEFNGLNDVEKMCFLLSNDDIIQYTAKACYEILKLRQIFIYR